MRKGRRSVERLFYWGLGWVRAAAMIWLLAMPLLLWAQPTLTTISDTVYRADGTAAGGRGADFLAFLSNVGWECGGGG